MTQNQIYKLEVENRYCSWSTYLLENKHFENPVFLKVDPLDNKLFSGDTFSIDCNNKLQLISSKIRTGTQIAGILVLSDNKTYGRKNKRLLYKCVPDDKSLPLFLIPYEMKHVGFVKVFVNLYVTFTFTDWDDKHPYGILSQTIGPVDVLDNFYEYRLYCKHLNISLKKFQKDVKAYNKETNISDLIKEKYPDIEDRTHVPIFSIDPEGSADFDDAFSIRDLDNGVKLISIYIANVPLIIDVLNCWDSFSKRTSTIYLPDKKRPMLPAILSDCLCSLQAGVVRAAFHMDVYIDKCAIIDIKFGASLVKLYKNYCYEEPDLLNNPEYTLLIKVTRELNTVKKYLDFIVDSHDVVCYLMILMNYYCAKKMLEYNTGIFRSTIVREDQTVIPQHVPADVSKFLKVLSSTRGQYVTCLNNIRHDALGLDAYIHITSPIRRLVDLLNMIKFQQITDIAQFSEKVSHFYQIWTADLEYINVSMKSIRALQNECNLLSLCTNCPDLLQREYIGYIIQHGGTAPVNPRLRRGSGNLGSLVPKVDYKVYLPELKLMTKFKCDQEFEDYRCAKFKLYLFHDEDNLQRKIRVQLQT